MISWRIWLVAGAVATAAVAGVVQDGYPAWRSVDAEATRLSVWPDRVLLTPDFEVLYPPEEAQAARLIARLADRDYREETRILDVYPPSRLTLIVYPSLASLATSAGLPRSADDIGLYDGGTIRIANPHSWLSGRGWARAFAAEGPVGHELGHALLDVAADGNFPAWFNEGVAQEEDYRVTGFIWLTATNGVAGRVYSLRQLQTNFYGLANQSLAYHEGLLLVQYLIALRGQGAFDRFIAALGHGGPPFADALQDRYGLSPETLFRAWRQSLHQAPLG